MGTGGHLADGKTRRVAAVRRAARLRGGADRRRRHRLAARPAPIRRRRELRRHHLPRPDGGRRRRRAPGRADALAGPLFSRGRAQPRVQRPLGQARAPDRRDARPRRRDRCPPPASAATRPRPQARTARASSPRTGVGCEACHGGASGWIASHYAVGASHADNVGARDDSARSGRSRARRSASIATSAARARGNMSPTG